MQTQENTPPLNIQDLTETLKTRFGEVHISLKEGKMRPEILISPAVMREVAFFLRDEEGLRFNYLMCLSGIHYKTKKEDQLAVVYHLNAMQLGYKLNLKVLLHIENPRLSSVEQVWKTADWHEREIYDMYGIEFEGHPDMRRILCPDDWTGYPLRKDYEPQNSYGGITTEY